MSKQRVIKIWMPVLALILLPLVKAVVIDAAPARAPVLGLTPTPTPTTPTPCTRPPCCVPPCPTCTAPPECCPVTCTPTTPTHTCALTISKHVKPTSADAVLGTEFTFTILVENVGNVAAEDVRVVDVMPDYLQIFGAVEIAPQDQRSAEYLPDSHTVDIDLQDIGRGSEVKIVIHTKLGPPNDALDWEPYAGQTICVDNEVWFESENCGENSAHAAPCWLPETGGKNNWWVLAAGLATGVLVLSLAFSKKWR